MDAQYNSVCNLISEVSDAVVRKELMDRVAAKYELLSGEVQDTWLELIEVNEEEKLSEIQDENAIQAQESLEQAASELKDRRIAAVETYIGYLNERTLYTDYVETLIT